MKVGKVEGKSEWVEGVLALHDIKWNEIGYEGLIGNRYWRVVITDFQMPRFLSVKMFMDTQLRISVPPFKEEDIEELIFWQVQERKDKKAYLVWVGSKKVGKKEEEMTLVISGVKLLEEFSQEENAKLLLDAFGNSHARISCVFV